MRMKNLLKILFVVALAFAATSTSAHNFKFKNGEIFYQCVFEGVPPNVMPFKLETRNDSVMTGSFVNYSIREKAYKETRGGKTKILYMPYRFPMSANVVVEVRENRYRVTISQLDFINDKTLYTLESCIIYDEGFEMEPYSLSMLNVIDKEFDNIFTRKNEAW